METVKLVGLAFPLLWERWATEACASGLPCLVHRHPVMEWMIGPGGEGHDFEAPGGLAAALGQWLPSADFRRQAGVAAREHCVQHFSRERVVQQILDYYKWVLEGQVTLESPALATPVRPLSSQT